jgi:type IV secretion system protein VirB9
VTRRFATLGGIATLVTWSPALAEVLPKPGTGDPHIQTVVYDPQQVVAIHVEAGFAVTVELSPEERIETVTVGDAGSWQVQVNRRADRLVIKPVGYPRPTNLTAITDQRSYNFTLYSANISYEALPYTVSFTYPAPAMEQPVPVAVATGRYRLRGDRHLRPAAISDNGEFTSIIWPTDVTLPAVYKEDERGNAALVNGLMRDGAYVVEGVHRRLVFVIGKARATATRYEPKEAE